jgi:hypothetical protein
LATATVPQMGWITVWRYKVVRLLLDITPEHCSADTIGWDSGKNGNHGNWNNLDMTNILCCRQLCLFLDVVEVYEMLMFCTVGTASFQLQQNVCHGAVRFVCLSMLHKGRR